jgi:hypothetical protein
MSIRIHRMPHEDNKKRSKISQGWVVKARCVTVKRQENHLIWKYCWTAVY